MAQIAAGDSGEPMVALYERYGSNLYGLGLVRFHAAVDPAKYPVIAVTEESGDGDPQPSRPDVLRSRAE